MVENGSTRNVLTNLSERSRLIQADRSARGNRMNATPFSRFREKVAP
jgi:hypothetical protein